MSVQEIPVFGFKVSHETYTDYTAQGEPYDIEGWTVSLPHQCDCWDIAESDSHERAVALLRAFIDEAQEAMNALVDERPFGGTK